MTVSGLTDVVKRGYFLLRQRIEAVTGQVNYLQDYIRQQCQK
ncbi:lysis system i-spanin subunit Rz [Enterobacter sp. TMH.L2]